MKPKIYIETTIPSYLTAWPSRDFLRAAHQQMTRNWWDSRRSGFELYVSQFVIQEVGAGDQVAAAERLEILAGIPILDPTAASEKLAGELIVRVPLPPRAIVDAAHIATAVANGMDFLLTWNCTHIANASLRVGIDAVCRSLGYTPTVICTPEELMEKEKDNG
jgi:PIN domain